VIFSRHQHSFTSLLAALILLAAVDDAAAQADETQALQEVQSELRALERRLESQREEREASSRVLRTAELEAASAAGDLRDIRAQLAEQRARQDALAEEMRQANERLDGERDALTQQIRMSYIAGRQEGVKLLLNQDTPARLGRMVVYYDYLNRARSARLGLVQTEIENLQNLEAESVRLGENLASLEASQAATVTRLESSRDERRSVLARLEEDIDSSGTAIARLREEAQRLGDLISEIRNARIALPPDAEGGFASVAGELEWPVSGSLVNDFGQSRAGGELRWNGVVIGAPAGTSVRAVYHGRVAYADWLPGLGLLIIVEHGGGYMSLYGHNEAILKASGDWVEPGEIIAHVGDSGGQSETAIYFEIRRDGEPIDPRPWMARSVDQAR
jgi:septal ring factor EnvC (AmiA/AmiB activator)